MSSNHLDFPRGQFGTSRALFESSLNFRSHSGMSAFMDVTNHLDEIVAHRVFQKIGCRTGLQRGVNVLFALRHGQHNDLGGGIDAADCVNRVDAADGAKLQIHEGHRWAAAAEQVDRLSGRFRETDDFHIRLSIYDERQTVAHDAMIVDAEDANLLVRHDR